LNYTPTNLGYKVEINSFREYVSNKKMVNTDVLGHNVKIAWNDCANNNSIII
jgi:hypothetical protein